jgi:hypothetical protein
MRPTASDAKSLQADASSAMFSPRSRLRAVSSTMQREA